MRKYLEGLLSWVLKIGTWFGAGLAAIIAFFEWFTDLIIDLTVWAVQEIAQIQAPDFQFTLSDHNELLSLANHFLPLAELWAFVVVTVPYMLLIVTVRFVKQWIPTLSN